MKRFIWDPAKNRLMKKTRGVSFEDVVFCIENGKLLTILRHPNVKRYGNPRLFVIDINGYAWVAPFIEDERTIVLKTVFPSRKLTHLLLRGKDK